MTHRANWNPSSVSVAEAEDFGKGFCMVSYSTKSLSERESRNTAETGFEAGGELGELRALDAGLEDDLSAIVDIGRRADGDAEELRGAGREVADADPVPDLPGERPAVVVDQDPRIGRVPVGF